MSDASCFLAKNKTGKILLFLYAVTFQCAHADNDVEIAPWVPPHINSELNLSFTYDYLIPLIRSDVLFLTTSLSLELIRLISYNLSSRVASVETAWLLSDGITRLMDASMDYSLSEDYSDFALRAFFSNIDKLPGLSSNSGYSRISRRALVYLYIFRRHIARHLPGNTLPRVPVSVYLHAPSQEKMLHIVLVPPSSSGQYDPTIENSSYFILSKKDSGIACDQEKAKIKSSIDGLIHQLNCHPSVRIHLYPQKWQGENRLYIRIFREGLAGPLYLSPYSYGEVNNTYFFSDLMDRIEEFKKQDFAFTSQQENYFGQFMLREQNSTAYQESSTGGDTLCYGRHHTNIANPLDERTFSLIQHLMEQLPDHFPRQNHALPLLKDSMADAILLEELELDIDPEPGDTIETESLSLISAGKHSFLILDQGVDKNKVPIVSLETRYALEAVDQATLEQIEQHRSATLSDQWWLTFEITHLMAMQLLSGIMQKYVNKHYSKPLEEGGHVKLTDNHHYKIKKAPEETGTSGNAKDYSANHATQNHENKRPSRKKKLPRRLQNDDKDIKRPKRPRKQPRPSHYQSPQELPTAIKKSKNQLGEAIVTKEATELEGTSRKEILQHSPVATSAFSSIHNSLEVNPECLVRSPGPLISKDKTPKSTSGRQILKPRKYADFTISANSDEEGGADASSDSEIALPSTDKTIEASNKKEVSNSFTTASSTLQPIAFRPLERLRWVQNWVQSLLTAVTQDIKHITQYQHLQSESALSTTKRQSRIAIPEASSTALLQTTEDTQLTLQALGIKPNPLPTTVIIADEPHIPARFRPGETEGGTPCPVIGCRTKTDKHPRFSTYDYWWEHIKVHAGITYDGKSFTTSHNHGAAIMAKQKGYKCQIAGCASSGSSFEDLEAFGRHLAAIHLQELDQQTFNQYQLNRLLNVARALKIQIEGGEQPFRAEQTYYCGISGCGHSVVFLNDQAIYKDLVNHRNAEHSDISIGRHSPGPDLSEMAKKNYRYFAKKYQTRFGLGWFCTGCEGTIINQSPEALGAHFTQVHLQEGIYCPVKNCNDPKTGERIEFPTLQSLYAHHMTVHQPVYIETYIDTMAETADQVKKEHSYCIPVQTDDFTPSIVSEGWIKPEDLDLFMLKRDETDEYLAPGSMDIVEYQPE